MAKRPIDEPVYEWEERYALRRRGLFATLDAALQGPQHVFDQWLNDFRELLEWRMEMRGHDL